MSSGLDEKPKEEVERRQLRRSERQRKKTVVARESSSDTETEVETVQSEIGSEECCKVTQREYIYKEGRYKLTMDNGKDQIEGPPGSTYSMGSVDSGLGRAPEAGLAEFMKLYISEQLKRDDRHERERREEAIRREEERREAREREDRERAEARDREERMWRAMNRAATTPEPEPRVKPMISLPFMKEGGEITEFLPQFEAALEWGKVPQDQKRELLVSHLPISLLMRVKSQVDEDGSYEELVGALNSSSTLTFSAAAEDLCPGERGRIWEMTGSKAIARVKGLISQVTKDADTKPEMIECMTVALVRDKLVLSLKSYVDSARN